MDALNKNNIMSNIDSFIGVGVTWVQCNDSGIRIDTQTTVFVKHHTALNFNEWVNLSKSGVKDGVFRGLEGLLRGISRG